MNFYHRFKLNLCSDSDSEPNSWLGLTHEEEQRLKSLLEEFSFYPNYTLIKRASINTQKHCYYGYLQLTCKHRQSSFVQSYSGIFQQCQITIVPHITAGLLMQRYTNEMETAASRRCLR